MKFPIFKTKIKGITKIFDLTDPNQQKEYFQLKAGPEIKKLRDFLKNNTFVAYLLGKKNSGKGTYSKMFADLILPEKIDHFSIGDMVRGVDEELKDKRKKKELRLFLEKNYRGWQSLKEVFYTLEHRDTKTLLPTELVLALVKREIEKREKKTIFIDGFPRELDQIGFSLFFRDLIGHRDDPDIFVLIDVPKSVIDERIKWRRVCPLCKTSRNLKLLPTSKVGYDEKKKEFYLICDNPNCKGNKVQSGKTGRNRRIDKKYPVIMVTKEGDELGIKPLRPRLELDEKLIQQAVSLYGIPKIFLRNSIPVKKAKDFVDDYELTPEYIFEWDEKQKRVIKKERPWVVKDDEGVDSYSLMPPPVVVAMIKQLVEIFGL